MTANGATTLRAFIVSGRWTGVMVEPVPHLFDRLRRNYDSTDRVVCENAAISRADGRRPFYQRPAGIRPRAGRAPILV